ncbi:MAG: hypothetical protein OXT72_00185 [Gammaproteobacteria bacterium]|nr:hypothetical protein [Gammaproteobacteria bacterium]MDE0246968.1 hypothetical protein [Gammaproteobacteria bacterium]
MMAAVDIGRKRSDQQDVENEEVSEMKRVPRRLLPTLVLLAPAVLALLTGIVGCGAEQTPEARPELEPEPAADAGDAEGDEEGGGVSQEGDPSNEARSWCDPGQTVLISFEAGESGRTVSLCRDGDILTYVFGHLGDQPELVYSGPVLGNVSGTAVLWGEGVSSLAELAVAREDPDATWMLDLQFYQDEESDIRRLAQSDDTGGFVFVRPLTGLLDQSVYIFRRGGWEYTIISEGGRGMNDPDMASYESQSISVRSPSGELHYPN